MTSGLHITLAMYSNSLHSAVLHSADLHSAEFLKIPSPCTVHSKDLHSAAFWGKIIAISIYICTVRILHCAVYFLDIFRTVQGVAVFQQLFCSN